MAISSIHIEPGKVGFFKHNSREKKTTNSIFFDEDNYFSCDFNTAIKIYRSELEVRSSLYKNRTGQSLQKKAITLLSAIVNFNKEHTQDDIARVCKHLENKFDTKVIQYSMHRDEGHIREDGSIDKNYHAHIEFMGLDSKGNSIRRKLDKKALINLQTEVAELLKMKRGRNFNKEFRDYKRGNRTDIPKKAKRLGTYEYKEHAKQKAATIKDLKQKVNSLRAELKYQGAEREDYAALETIVKNLKEKLRTKNLSLSELDSILNYKLKENKRLNNKIDILEDKNLELTDNYVDEEILKEKLLEENIELKQGISTLRTEFKQEIQEREELEKQLKLEKFRLKRTNIKVKLIKLEKYMKQEINSISIRKTYQRILFHEAYGVNLLEDLNGYFINLDDPRYVTVRSRQQKVEIIDKGDIIVSKDDNLEKQVEIMLIMAKAKNWNIYDLEIKGSREFKKEVNKQLEVCKLENENEVSQYDDAKMNYALFMK